MLLIRWIRVIAAVLAVPGCWLYILGDRNMRVCYASDMGFNTVQSPGAWSRRT